MVVLANDFIPPVAEPNSFFDKISKSFNDFWRDRAIRKVEKDPYALRDVSAKYRDDEGVVFAAVRQTGCVLSVASERLKGNKAIVLEAVSRGGWAHTHGHYFCPPHESVSEALRDDQEVVDAAFQANHESLKFASKRCVLEIVKADGCNLCYASEAHRNDPDIVKAATDQNKFAVKYAGKEYWLRLIQQNAELSIYDLDHHLRKDPDIILAFLDKDPYILMHQDPELLLNREFALKAVQKQGCALEYFPAFQNDALVVEAAYQKDPASLRFASRALVLAKVGQDGLALQHAEPVLKDDPEVIAAAYQNNPASLQFASKPKVLEIVSQNGLAIEHAGYYRYDDEVSEAAFQNNPHALQFASHNFVLAKLQQHGSCLRFASEQYRGFSIFVDAAFQNDPFSLQYAAHDAIRHKLRDDGLALQYTSDEQKNNHELVLQAVRQNGLALQYASEALRADREIVRAAIRQNPDALQFAAEALRNDPTIHHMHDYLPFMAEGALFRVKTEDIDNAPLQVLLELRPKMGNGFPRIEYIGSPGVDAGGLSRDFVSRIMQALAKEKPLPMLEEGGKIIPMIEDGNPDQIAGYQAIGAIFAAALEKRKQIVTGNYFHPMVFQMMHCLTEAEIAVLPELNNYADLPEAAVNKLFRVYAKENLHFSDEEITKILDGEIPERLQGLGFDAKEDFFNDNFKKLALASAAISQSARSHLSQPANWDHIKGPADQFAAKIEGSLTREAVMDALQWEKEDAVSKGYLEQWLGACSIEDMEKFVWAITGSKTIAPGQKLKIEPYSTVDNNKLPNYHTCFFKMDLPDGYPTYEVFKAKLELSLSSVNGMQMA